MNNQSFENERVICNLNESNNLNAYQVKSRPCSIAPDHLNWQLRTATESNHLRALWCLEAEFENAAADTSNVDANDDVAEDDVAEDDDAELKCWLSPLQREIQKKAKQKKTKQNKK